jgi:uncharacterized membrane protein
MSQIVVVAFNTETEAQDALKTLRGLEKQGRIAFEDTAVVVHQQDGTMKVRNELSGTTESGAVVGAILGGVLLVAFPVAGLALGALAGAGIGASLGRGIDGTFVKDVQAKLPPGKSALFAVIKSADRNAALAAMRPFHGEVIQTTLDDDVEASLREALR